jgi:tRNA(fMet)-specific endonuclease VapC
MILLDTDHLTAFGFPTSQRYRVLAERLDGVGEPVSTTIVNAEEQVRGWLAVISRAGNVRTQIPHYQRLTWLFEFLGRLRLVTLDGRAAEEFERQRKARVRIGTNDLKIASIAIVNDALLLSANLRDFRQVSGLRIENWLD